MRISAYMGGLLLLIGVAIVGAPVAQVILSGEQVRVDIDNDGTLDKSLNDALDAGDIGGAGGLPEIEVLSTLGTNLRQYEYQFEDFIAFDSAREGVGSIARAGWVGVEHEGGGSAGNIVGTTRDVFSVIDVSTALFDPNTSFSYYNDGGFTAWSTVSDGSATVAADGMTIPLDDIGGSSWIATDALKPGVVVTLSDFAPSQVNRTWTICDADGVSSPPDITICELTTTYVGTLTDALGTITMTQLDEPHSRVYVGPVGSSFIGNPHSIRRTIIAARVNTQSHTGTTDGYDSGFFFGYSSHGFDQLVDPNGNHKGTYGSQGVLGFRVDATRSIWAVTQLGLVATLTETDTGEALAISDTTAATPVGDANAGASQQLAGWTELAMVIDTNDASVIAGTGSTTYFYVDGVLVHTASDTGWVELSSWEWAAKLEFTRGGGATTGNVFFVDWIFGAYQRNGYTTP